MDAYSYLCRGGVFANAQTGNMLLLGVNLANRNFSNFFKYVWPVMAFTLGIMLADYFKARENTMVLHWRHWGLVVEILGLLLVASIPQNLNWVANMLTSFVCGIQVEGFRSLKGYSIATTMCIGNLRSGTFYLDKYLRIRDKKHLKESFLYYGIIVFFVVGATTESFLIDSYGEKAILFSVVLLLLVFLLLLKDLDFENKDLKLDEKYVNDKDFRY